MNDNQTYWGIQTGLNRQYHLIVVNFAGGNTGPWFNIKTVFPGVWIKIRQLWYCLIFIIGIPKLVRWCLYRHLYIERALGARNPCHFLICCLWSVAIGVCHPGGHNWCNYPGAISLIQINATYLKIRHLQINLQVPDLQISCRDFDNMIGYQESNPSNGLWVTGPIL